MPTAKNPPMSAGTKIGRDVGTHNVTIPSGSTSATLGIGPAAWGVFQFPAAMTGTSLTIQFSVDKTNWTTVPTSGSEANPVSFVANQTVQIMTIAFSSGWIRFLSNGSEAADREIKVTLKG